MVIAVASAPTVAQVADENAERVFELAANADSVDGQHAVKYSTKKSKRANKLVATNAAGYLPSNIVKPRWGYIKNKPAGFADNKDNVGVARLAIKQANGYKSFAAGATGSVEVACPAGSKVVGGGFSQPSFDVRITVSRPYGLDTWKVWALNLGTVTRAVSVYALCVATVPGGALS